MGSFLIPALTTLGYSLPELLACGIALAMLWSAARPGKPRQLGLIGIGLMLGCAVLQLALGLYQNWVIHSLAGDSATQISTIFARLGAVRMLINCVSLAGLVMIAWGLCKATRPAEAAARTTPGP
ncbi:MAG TPA: hypothetical protein VFH12_07200 [Pseudoxanthomonas sp.]|nr:hypothetical protein [Pseudoxanthomonas sp.]